MLHPVGPHSPGVYWVRRAIAVAVAVIVVIGVVMWLLGRGSEPDVDPAASVGTSETTELTGVLAPAPTAADDGATDPTPRTTAADTAPTDTSSTSGPATPTSSAKSGETSSAATSGDKKSGAKKSDAKKTGAKKSDAKKSDAKKSDAKKSGAKKSDAKKSDAKKTGAKKSGAKKTDAKKTGAKPATTTSATPTTTAPPKPSYDDHGRLICPDSAITLVAGTRSASYPVGAFPVLTLTIVNSGHESCVRDVSGTLQVFTVYTESGDRVWSTDDCFPGVGTEIHQFAPGEKRTYPVTWSGTTSEPTCTAERVQVSPGKYTVVAALGSLKSKPAAFTVTG